MSKKKVKELSDLIAVKSEGGVSFHPIDRFFLNSYIEEILSLDKREFLLYNLEHRSNLYSRYLMLCLPELWEDFDIDDLIYLLTNFSNIFSFFGFISFTYTFVEIDVIGLTFSLKKIKDEYKSILLTHLKSQYINFFKDETDVFFLEEDVLGVHYERWRYIKQKLLLDERIAPALESPDELKEYIDKLGNAWGNG